MAESLDEPLGRLFMTKSQRHLLEQMSKDDIDTASTNTQQNVPLKFNGFILQKGHRPKIFINDRLLHKLSAINKNINIQIDNSEYEHGKVRLSTGLSRAYIKPGQIWIPGSGEIKESYQLDITNE